MGKKDGGDIDKNDSAISYGIALITVP